MHAHLARKTQKGGHVIQDALGRAAPAIIMVPFDGSFRLMLLASRGKGLNLTVDMLSGPTVSGTMACTALLGRIVNIGRLAGMKAEFDFDAHARQRIDYIGVTFRTRTIEEVREILIKMRADLWDDVKAGRIKVPIDKTYPLAEAKAGHEHMRTNQHFGKILLIP